MMPITSKDTTSHAPLKMRAMIANGMTPITPRIRPTINQNVPQNICNVAKELIHKRTNKTMPAPYRDIPAIKRNLGTTIEISPTRAANRKIIMNPNNVSK
jgi:hypothetical protein